jgi:hypothetical protein
LATDLTAAGGIVAAAFGEETGAADSVFNGTAAELEPFSASKLADSFATSGCWLAIFGVVLSWFGVGADAGLFGDAAVFELDSPHPEQSIWLHASKPLRSVSLKERIILKRESSNLLSEKNLETSNKLRCMRSKTVTDIEKSLIS